MKKLIFSRNSGNIVLVVSISFLMIAQTACVNEQKADESPNRYVVVSDDGIMHWEDTGKEICQYGVNYTVPFAHAYRVAGYLGVDREKAIRDDVYHFARLGLDAFRVHVWDCEISDTLGNLLENEHLRLLDYQMSEMKKRGMKSIITPIAFWGNGYPERDEDTPGFADKYGKGACLTNPDAIKAQEVYLDQFVRHVNPYTGLAYKDDPDIIAFEVSNEPHHGGTFEETRDFINRMVQAIRNSGCMKPLFYNTSHSIQLGAAYFASDIQGGTYQWYPSGLVAGHEVRGNFLPNVTVYNIPYDTVPGYDKMANIVYEYDAADIGRSYIHPYMAKSFREAGMQFVAQFAYDPTYMAFANTEYQTHYMNFVYTPQKALSLKIASEVFHRLPRGEKIGIYPADTSFNVFRASYLQDLSEMVSDEKFIYTNNTNSHPPNLDMLEQIAGYGSSPLVSYKGCGAYLLDRLDHGVWRLEVMPDAVWVKDPFERASLRKKVAVILWKEHPMTINLPDMGTDFNISGLNVGNNTRITASDGTFNISPGAYLLEMKGNLSGFQKNDVYNNIILSEFAAPPSNCDETYFIHKPVQEVSDGNSLLIVAKIVSTEDPESVELLLFAGRRPERIEMQATEPYTYIAEIDGERVREKSLRYYIVLKERGVSRTYPGALEGEPSDWDYYDPSSYSVRVTAAGSPLLLFEAEKDAGMLIGNSFVMAIPSVNPGNTVARMMVMDLNRGEHQIAMRYFFGDKIKGRKNDLKNGERIIIQGYSTTGSPVPVEVSLRMDDGTTYGAIVNIGQYGTYEISLRELKKTRTINIPQGFPIFLPFYAEGDFNRAMDAGKTESIQFSIGPGIPGSEYNKPYGIAIEKAFLKLE